MISYRIILVALDFSDCNQDLVDHAASLAVAYQARVVLLHVAELPSGLDPDAKVALPGGAPEAAVQLLVRSSEERLKGYLSQLEKSGLEVSTLVAVGDAATTVVEQAAAQAAELIVMGTHGRRGLSRVVSGSA